MINAAAPYRRDSRQTVRVPVVMPLIEITADQQGYLTITLEREPYSADGALRRDDLKRVLDDIAADLGTPVRVEVRESDGSVFTDILTPPHPAVEPAAIANRASVATAGPTALDVPSLNVSAFGIAGAGFAAGEPVAVCVVVACQTADQDGAAHLRLPPALLANHRDVVLVGRTTGAVALGEGPALIEGAALGEGAA